MFEPAVGPGFIDWAVAECSSPGEPESGDASVVAPMPGGALFVVIDGLGHGSEAARAARLGLEIIHEHAGEDLQSLIERCHRALRYSRGAVMTLAQVNFGEDLMTWLGVGNVEGRLVRARPLDRRATESPLLVGGVVGHKLPRLHATSATVSRGDLIIFATDGVTGALVDHLAPEGTPQQIADTILEKHWKGSDDALVLVARYLGKM